MTSELRRRKRDFARRRARQAIRAARAQGCTCHEPQVLVEWNSGDVVSLVHVVHDEWCPLLRVMQERAPRDRYQAVMDPSEPYCEAP